MIRSLEGRTSLIPLAIEEVVKPWVWAAEEPGRARFVEPVNIPLADSYQVATRQYPIRSEARLGLKLVVERFLKFGLIRTTQSPWNTPILLVRKPDGSYRFVQDLSLVNKNTQAIHAVVPNPYTLT